MVRNRSRWCYTLLLLITAFLTLTGMGWAAEKRIVLPEQLNVHWSRELVTYPFTADNGACVVESVRLTGPQGMMPVQLSQVEYWPDTKFVKTATLAFVVDDLAPLATHKYTLTYDTSPAKSPAVAADLQITRKEGSVEAVTGQQGVRLLFGDKTYAQPAPAAEVPGPVQGMRLSDGAWYGGSRMYGDTKITSYTARLTDSGPVFLRAEYTYTYEDTTTLTLSVMLHAQARQVFFTTETKENRGKDGWDLLLTPGLPALTFQFLPEVQRLQSDTRDVKGWKEKAIADYKPGLVTNLSPWGEWWNEFTQTKFYLKFTEGERELFIARQDAGAWVTPTKEGNKVIPLMKGEDGSLYLRVNNAFGQRKWSVGENLSWETKLPKIMRPQFILPDDVEALNVVKDMVLDWPDSEEKHPRLFLNPEEMTKAAESNPAALKQLQNVKELRRYLGLYGFFDTMRYAAAAASLYDGTIDTNLITPEERKLFRAQMAFLAYRVASPATWSPERGFASGNPNMTVANVLNRGLFACTLRDHPLAKAWIEQPLSYMDAWMDRLDAKGHWRESGHYSRVSVSKFMLFAIAIQKAGFRDYFTDPRMKRMALYYEKTLTPPDPQRALTSSPPKEAKFGRVSPPYGRGSHGSNWGLGGLSARATTKTDPELSKILQWSFQQGNYSTLVGEGMAGFDALYPDRTLPAQAPTDWTSEFMPSLGALLRNGVGTPEENYLLLVTRNPTNPDGEIWPSEVGGLSIWFAKGRPIARRFTSVPDMNQDHGLLISRVMLATNWKPGEKTAGGFYNKDTQLAFAAQPRLDYVSAEYEFKQAWMQVNTPPLTVPAFPTVPKAGIIPPAGKPPVTWQRQALWVHDDTPDGVQYLVLRDSVTGGQPTQWQFWTTSEKIGTPDEVRDREAFLQDKPGAKCVDAHEIIGNRFTALGTLDVDIDYYIASPTDTPRHTLRYGSTAPGYHVRNFPLYQDLLHLQLPGDGTYFVALYPRMKTEVAPQFTTLANGTVIKASGTFGVDYAFLSKEKATATAEEADFDGTAASVQRRANGIVLALGAPGTVSYMNYAVTAPMPVSLRIATDKLTLTCAAEHQDGQVNLRAPGAWKLQPAAGVTCKRQGAQYLLTIPAGCAQVVLVKGK
ncbi:MAG: hypothetical protein ACYDBB_11355 [Armatimonadota bacterium]